MPRGYYGTERPAIGAKMAKQEEREPEERHGFFHFLIFQTAGLLMMITDAFVATRGLGGRACDVLCRSESLAISNSVFPFFAAQNKKSPGKQLLFVYSEETNSAERRKGGKKRRTVQEEERL